jgi:predicted RecB family nuclease
MHIADDGTLTWSASDLYTSTNCEFALLCAVDVLEGRLPQPDFPTDLMLERTRELGDVHEQRILAAYKEQFGDGVVEIERPGPGNSTSRADAVAATSAALTQGADVVFQAAFHASDPDTGSTFVGYADFIVRQPDGTYRVEDTKLARRAKVIALLQLAAYAEQLERLGIAVDPTLTIILGTGERSDHPYEDIVPVLRVQRERLLALVAERRAEGAASNTAVQWGDERYSICGKCDWCSQEIAATGDIRGVAGMTLAQRTKLRGTGVTTIAELASSVGQVKGIGGPTLERLRAQARLQLTSGTDGAPAYEIVDAQALGAIPEPSPGDIFFDFEGDPLHEEHDTWGLDYLWGWVDAQGEFECLWAHDFAGERQALAVFLAMVAERRAAHPDMHIYHYASYERTHLSTMSARWGIGEHEVDTLLREDVLVDLYPIVKKALLVGTSSYSIKKLEPLYMGDEHRAGVDNAGDSMVEYAAACERRDEGDDAGFAAKLADIEQYNAYDCASTLALRDWLLARGAESGVKPRHRESADDAEVVPYEPSPLEVALLGRADATGDERFRLAAAAVDFYRRERKTFWHDHFARLSDPIEEWADTRDVFVVENVDVQRDWHKEGKQRSRRRHLLLQGVAAPGSRFAPGQEGLPFALYDERIYEQGDDPMRRVAHAVTVSDAGDDWILVEELEKGGITWDALPVALTPSKPPATDSIEVAIAEWGTRLLGGTWPRDPASDLVARALPRLNAAGLAPVSADDYVSAVADSVLRLDGSVLAVQGPPGTGKTYVGSRVIERLVMDYGWRVAVVAQSHKVVEHLLEAVVDAGIPPERVGKEMKAGQTSDVFTVIPSQRQRDFVASAPAGGYVIGGTMWHLTHLNRVDRGQFDLLVVDEAGQFALADAIASVQCAQRLLLLGDPQQLPRVTQGIHPAPIDTSALEWLSEGADVLAPERGYFLAQSRRMAPAVTAPVSRLSYAGQLESHAVTSERVLEGVDPGLVAVPVEHSGSSTSSPEESAEVARIVQEVMGAKWTDPSAGRNGSPLTPADFVVVTPYNAQRAEVHAALAAAGLGDVPVGTVDLFQGQEAVISIVSLAASSAAEVRRGMEFLINRNRLNVAISRAKWRAYLVYSPGLLDALPTTPQRLAELGRFAALTIAASDGTLPNLKSFL